MQKAGVAGDGCRVEPGFFRTAAAPLNARSTPLRGLAHRQLAWWEVKRSEILLRCSVTQRTVRVPCWANYRLKTLWGGKQAHYVAGSTQAQWRAIYAV